MAGARRFEWSTPEGLRTNNASSGAARWAEPPRMHAAGAPAAARPLPAPLPAAVAALHELAGAWCLSRDGCIASTWRAETLPLPQRSWLLRAL
eukprot:7037996-Prymnesium_polylepis.1